tara:strand:- start:1665 stop:2279 length:615 start_codon:yes stop_codon:yes gene_type:complete
MTKTVNTFYNLINDHVLDSSDNGHGISYLELLQQYRDGNLTYLSGIISVVGTNYFSIILEQISNSALAALNQTESVYYTNETNGIYITNDEYTTLMNYIDSLNKTLEGIMQSLALYEEYELFKAAVETYQVAYDTLYDPDKLREFINQQASIRSISALDIETSLSVNPNLKPHIQEYVTLYGWPTNFIFDSSKMAGILINMGLV